MSHSCMVHLTIDSEGDGVSVKHSGDVGLWEHFGGKHCAEAGLAHLKVFIRVKERRKRWKYHKWVLGWFLNG